MHPSSGTINKSPDVEATKTSITDEWILKVFCVHTHTHTPRMEYYPTRKGMKWRYFILGNTYVVFLDGLFWYTGRNSCFHITTSEDPESDGQRRNKRVR